MNKVFLLAASALLLALLITEVRGSSRARALRPTAQDRRGDLPGKRGLCSPRWCFAEVSLACSLGKPVFLLRLKGDARLALLDDTQWIDLVDGERAYARLWEGLKQAGLDPADSFAWDPTRRPYVDQTVRLWDVASCKLYGQSLTGHTDLANAVAFSPDGELLALGSADETVRLWESEVKLLVPKVCRTGNRNLSQAQWRRSVGPEVKFVHSCSSLPARTLHNLTLGQ